MGEVSIRQAVLLHVSGKFHRYFPLIHTQFGEVTHYGSVKQIWRCPLWAVVMPRCLTHSGDMTNHIRYHREKHRLTREQLARRVGTSVSQITKLERGERKLTQEWLERLSAAMSVHPVALLSAWTADVIGQVRSDGAIVYREKGGIPSVDEVDIPAQAPESIRAIEVAGDDLLGFADAGSFLFFDWEAPEHIHKLLGRMAVVWCRDGRILVRRIMPGRADGLWSLVTAAGSAEYDVDLMQAIPITWIRLPQPHNGDEDERG